jgi:hypothetical protein
VHNCLDDRFVLKGRIDGLDCHYIYATRRNHDFLV